MHSSTKNKLSYQKIQLLIASSLLRGVGTKTLQVLRNFLLDNQEIHRLDELICILQKKEITEQELKNADKEAQLILGICEDKNIKILPYHKDFPLLYAKGNLNLLTSPNRCAIIGTRKPLREIEELTYLVSNELSNAGTTIVSGLARGVDSIAHKGALMGIGSTIAVLPSGLAAIYPIQNYNLALEIMEKGLIISAYPPFFRATNFSLVARNQIISYLSHRVIVAQSRLEGGARHAVDYALKNNIPVDAFAFQGDEFALNSRIQVNKA